MDLNYLINKIKNEIQKECPQLTKDIIDEFVHLTFWGANWTNYGDNQDIYILGLAETKYDFYYVGCNENYEIQLISCALEVKKNKERENDYLNNNWRTIRNNVKEYFKNHKEEKLIYFKDHILTNEHIVYDNEEKTKYHIEEL